MRKRRTSSHHAAVSSRSSSSSMTTAAADDDRSLAVATSATTTTATRSRSTNSKSLKSLGDHETSSPLTTNPKKGGGGLLASFRSASPPMTKSSRNPSPPTTSKSISSTVPPPPPPPPPPLEAETPVPLLHKQPPGQSNSQQQEQQQSKALHAPSTTTKTTIPPLAVTTATAARTSELSLRKFLLRLVIGSLLFSCFSGIVYLGHLYICILVAIIETVLFYELVRVRYSTFFHNTIKDTIPLFRTTQWMWFTTAIVYTYGDFVADVVQNNYQAEGHSALHHLVPYIPYTSSISFVLYSTTLMVTIVTLQREHLKFQINQLCWTVVVLCLTLGQLKYVMHNIFNGLIWFVLPVCLVITNDVMAYACGVTTGRKFISRPFLSFSPNKTWEGFLGGGFFTIVAAWYMSKYLVPYTWMTCPTNEFRVVPQSLECTLDPVFVPAQWVFPSQLFELLPQNLVRMVPGMVEICSTALPTTTTTTMEGSLTGESESSSEVDPSVLEWILEPCISGNDRQVHDHFELRIKQGFYPIQLHAVMLGFFASVVAPFGGFLASAIKRAYGLKDFAALLPGHGGVMDRMDCQFLMALCTWVYYNTFIKIATVSVTKLTYLYSLLSEREQAEFAQWIMETTNTTTTAATSTGME